MVLSGDSNYSNHHNTCSAVISTIEEIRYDVVLPSMKEAAEAVTTLLAANTTALSMSASAQVQDISMAMREARAPTTIPCT